MTPVERRRAAWRRSAACKRAQALALAQRGHGRCQRHAGPSICGGTIETVIDRLGRAHQVCPLCERRRRGICRDCNAPVAGRVGTALRCARCRRLAIRASQARHVGEHRAAINARARDAARRRDPEVKRRYKRLWRLAHPERVRAWKRKEALSRGAVRDRALAYQRRYRARHKRQRAARAMLGYYARHTARPVARCRVCEGYLDWTSGPGRGRPPRLCDAHAPAAELRRRRARGVSYCVVAEPPAPLPLPNLAKLARLAGVRERHCVSCAAAVSGRTKKCAACRARDLEAARGALARRAG